MNVKKRYFVVGLLALVTMMGTACSGNAGPTPTRTPRAVADKGDATQTPWIIYVPVTTTPEPFTVTPLPTVTSSQPQPPTAQPAQPTRTRAPATAKPVSQPTVATNSPTPVPPAATPTPACGPYTVAALGPLPENGVTRNTRQNPGGGMALVFNFTPAVGYPLDMKIGYELDIKGKTNRAARFISHNHFLDTKEIVLDPNATYELTAPSHDDTNVSWTITPVMVSAGFDDNNFQALGPAIPCGPATGPWTISLHVQ